MKNSSPLIVYTVLLTVLFWGCRTPRAGNTANSVVKENFYPSINEETKGRVIIHGPKDPRTSRSANNFRIVFRNPQTLDVSRSITAADVAVGGKIEVVPTISMDSQLLTIQPCYPPGSNVDRESEDYFCEIREINLNGDKTPEIFLQRLDVKPLMIKVADGTEYAATDSKYWVTLNPAADGTGSMVARLVDTGTGTDLLAGQRYLVEVCGKDKNERLVCVKSQILPAR